MDASGALCALLLSADPSAPAPATVALPPVEVPAPPEPAPPAPDSAARRDPSGSVTVIPVADRPAQARDTAELLAQAPGVLVQDLGGLGQGKSISIRGASSSGVLVLLDGMPLNGAGGIAELSRLPLALADSLEVLRGGAGARYGSGGLGGVVNVLTPDPRGPPMARAELEAGSFGTALARLAAEGPLLGGTGLAILHGGLTRGDFNYAFDPTPQLPGDPLVPLVRANNGARWGGALLKYRRALGDWSAGAMLEFSIDRRGLAGTVDYPTSDARQDGRRLAASLRAERPLGGGAGTFSPPAPSTRMTTPPSPAGTSGRWRGSGCARAGWRRTPPGCCGGRTRSPRRWSWAANGSPAPGASAAATRCGGGRRRWRWTRCCCPAARRCWRRRCGWSGSAPSPPSRPSWG